MTVNTLPVAVEALPIGSPPNAGSRTPAEPYSAPGHARGWERSRRCFLAWSATPGMTTRPREALFSRRVPPWETRRPMGSPRVGPALGFQGGVGLLVGRLDHGHPARGVRHHAGAREALELLALPSELAHAQRRARALDRVGGLAHPVGVASRCSRAECSQHCRRPREESRDDVEEGRLAFEILS